MNRYKKYIPIVAVVLIAFGVNLDKFGIDLEALSRGGSIGSSTSQPSTKGTGSGNQLERPNSANKSASHPDYPQWTNTNPGINMWHIFEGEINRSGKPVGYHSRPSGQDPVNARVVNVRDNPNKAGVYTATIAIRDGSQWKEKFSSFFPDSMSRDQVVQAVLNAYGKSKNPKKQPWQGPSGLGFNIQGYTSSRGGINTAFPVFVR